MSLTGHFELTRKHYQLRDPIWATLVINNDGDHDLFLFVSRARDSGIKIAVIQGIGVKLHDHSKEPEAGLVSEYKLSPSETFKQQYELSQWLTVTEAGDLVVECAIDIEAYNTSLHQDTVTRLAGEFHISTRLHFTMLPTSVKDKESPPL